MNEKSPYFDLIVKMRDGKHQIWKVRKLPLALFTGLSIAGLVILLASFTDLKSMMPARKGNEKSWQATFDSKSLKQTSDNNSSESMLKSLKVLKSNIIFKGNSTRIRLNFQQYLGASYPVSAKLSLILGNDKFKEYSIEMEENLLNLRNTKSGPILKSEFEIVNLNLDSLKNIKVFKIEVRDQNNREATFEFDSDKFQTQRQVQVSRASSLKSREVK